MTNIILSQFVFQNDGFEDKMTSISQFDQLFLSGHPFILRVLHILAQRS